MGTMDSRGNEQFNRRWNMAFIIIIGPMVIFLLLIAMSIIKI